MERRFPVPVSTMELLALAALAFVLGIPAAALYAVYKVSTLGTELTALRDEVSSLKQRVRLMGSGPRADRERSDAASPQGTRSPDSVTSPPRPAASRAAPPATSPDAPAATDSPPRVPNAGIAGAHEEARGDRGGETAGRQTPATDAAPEGGDPSPQPRDPSPRPRDPSSQQRDPSPRPRDPSSQQRDPSSQQRGPSERGPDPSERRGRGSTAEGARPETPPTGLDLETLIGSTWLLRIGLGVLAIALALFARSVAPQLPNAAKVGLAYAGSIAFFGLGRFFEDRLARFARPVMAGGLAFGFFVAYSAHFVPAMQAVSMPVSIVWMFVSMLTILVAAERWESESTAILAIVLGHIAAQVSAGQADAYALILIGFLGVTAILMLLRHRWVHLGLIGVAGSYGSHLLWLLADREPPVGNTGFWVSLAFLTSYYVIFLIADLLWWQRADDAPDVTAVDAPDATTADAPERSAADAEPPAEATDRGTVRTGSPSDESSLRAARALGPLNLVLYVSLTTFVYFVSGASVESIEWYFLSLGALQGVLTWLYRAADHEDYVFYPVFGTVLWTLGMFAALDALALNLVLSAQALVLLVAARRTSLTVFYWLAQAAMATAFIHFLVVPPPATPTLGALLGGLGVAAVYYTKACLEEDWYHLQSFLAPTHAALGSIVVVAHGVAYFRGSPGLGLLLSALFAVLLVVAALRGRHAILFGATTLAATLPLLTAGHAPSTLLLPCIAFALGAVALTWIVPQRFQDSDTASGLRQTQGVVVAILLAVVLAGSGFSGSVLEYLAWMIVPAILLVAQTRLSVADSHEQLSLGVNLGIALAVVVLTDAATAEPHLPAVWIASWAGVAMIAAALTHRRAFAETGYGILFGGYLWFLGIDLLGATGSSHPTFGSWWAGAVVALTPLLIGIAVDRHVTSTPGADSRENVGGDQVGDDEADGDQVGRDEADGHEPTEPRSRLDRLAEPFAPTLMGLLLLGVYAAAQGSIGFAYVTPAVVALLLVFMGDRIPALHMVVAALAAAVSLHVFFLASAGTRTGIESALPHLLVFAIATLAIERGAGARLLVPERDRRASQPVLTALVLLATGTAMTAIYLSLFVGPTWATAGWSLIGGSMMAAGFYFRAASYRRAGLVVLGVCLVRVFVVDTVGLSDTARIGAFFVLGLMLVGIALLYTRYSSELKDWL